MKRKHPICPNRIRTIPEQFSWLDHRLVRDRHIEHITHEAAALYLFLVTVADSHGLSYYADHSICQRLDMGGNTLTDARDCLQSTGLIAYEAPLYQVLELGTLSSRSLTIKTGEVTTTSSPLSIGAILKQIAGGKP
jgi:hypothetical protein